MSSEPEGASSSPRGEAGVPLRCDVVVLGASFAGVEVLLQLQRRLPRPLEIIVVDRQARHGYIPLVHERLCGRVPPATTELDTAAFVRSLPGTRFVQGEVVSLDPHEKVVALASGQRIAARFVVVALGSVLDPPPGLRGGEHLLRYKLGDELEHAQQQLDAALREGDDPPRVVVVGGGISGVELAGELAHLRHARPVVAAAKDWRSPTVTLVSASAQLLPELGAGVGRTAEAALREQGVDVRLETRLVAVEPGAVTLRGGEEASEERVTCGAALWAGGIRPARALEHLGLPRTDDGWLAVGPTLQCFAAASPSRPDVFACGDAVRVVGGTGVWPTMQRAIECLWQAKVVAKNIVTLVAHAPDYPKGVPPLRPHVLRPRFAYGVSLGARSLVVYGGLRVDLPGVNVWFRRWLMRQYFARYAPRGG